MATGTVPISQCIFMDKINGYFNYLLFNECGCRFDDICIHVYSYPPLNYITINVNLLNQESLFFYVQGFP